MRHWNVLVRLLMSGALCAVLVLAPFAPVGTVTSRARSGPPVATIELDDQGNVTATHAADATATPAAPVPLLSVTERTGGLSGGNLLPNGGFEDGMEGWSPMPSSRQISVTAGSEAPAEGGACALFKPSDGGDTGGGGVMSEMVPVSPGTEYRATCLWRDTNGYLGSAPNVLGYQRDCYTGDARGWGIHAMWGDPAGDLIGSQFLCPFNKNASAWKRTTATFAVPATFEGRPVAFVSIGIAVGLSTLYNDEAVLVDDVRLFGCSDPQYALTGEAGAVEGGYRLASTGAPALDATCDVISEDGVTRISGELTDTSGAPRALDLTVSVPAGRFAQRWWDGMRDSREVVPDAVYENSVSADMSAWMPVSFYPYCAVDDGDETGLALALPLDEPQLARLCYDPSTGCLEAEFHLGLSPATRDPGSAAFSLEVLSYPGAQGFRGCIERFGQAHAGEEGWFSSEVDVRQYTDYNRSRMDTEGHEEVEEGDYVAQYTVIELPIGDLGYKKNPPPSYGGALASTSRAEGAASNLARDTNGDAIMKKLAVFPWSRDQWEVIFGANADPDIPGAGGKPGFAQTVNGWIEAGAERLASEGSALDDVFFDNFMSMNFIDMDPAHIAVSDHPLTYSPNTFQPGVHSLGSNDEYMDWLRAECPDDLTFSANVWGLGTPFFLVPRLDLVINEGDPLDGEGGNWRYEILDYKRVLASQKPLMYAANGDYSKWDLPDVEGLADRALFYGIYAGQGNNSRAWPQGSDEVFTGLKSRVDDLTDAGWEQVTFAETGKPDAIWVERFGGPGEDIYFTVHNPGDSGERFSLEVDTAGLGVPTGSLVDVESGERFVLEPSGDGGHGCEMDLEPSRTRMLRLDSGGALAGSGALIAGALLVLALSGSLVIFLLVVRRRGNPAGEGRREAAQPAP